MSKLEPSDTDLVKECGGLGEVQKRERHDGAGGEVEELGVQGRSSGRLAAARVRRQVPESSDVSRESPCSLPY